MNEKHHRAELGAEGLFILFCCFVIQAGSSVTAQDKKADLEELLDQRSKMPAAVVQPQGIALESPVAADRYFVGPSDVIAVNIWMSPPLNLSLTVTPEGTLIIPTVGELSVSDKTLAAVKERVSAEVRKRYLRADVTVTLLRPRPIVVSVTGYVLNGGLYTLSAIDRANRAIDEANKPSRFQSDEQVKPILREMSTRNVVLRHRDGTQDRVDVAKFFATKEDRWNPYLREGDVIIVPRRNFLKNVFGIYGEVNAPGRYEFVEGDSLIDAIHIGQGFTRLARLDSMEFSRLSLDASWLSTSIIDVHAVLDGRLPNIAMEPGDRIVVKARMDLREDYRVTVEGEVLYPGTYPITKDATTLSEVIRTAGGFTEFASLQSAEVIRRSVKPEDLAVERLLSLRGGASVDDSADYILETELRLRKEIVNVDFPRLFTAGDSASDIILQTEDYVLVPSIRKTIYVFGQVVSPGHIPFVPGEGLDYYIRKAGGFTERARPGDVKIIKARTKQWLAPDETIIEEGDYAWIPKEPDRPFAYYMTIASQAASVLSVIIGIAVVITQVTK